MAQCFECELETDSGRLGVVRDAVLEVLSITFSGTGDFGDAWIPVCQYHLDHEKVRGEHSDYLDARPFKV